MSPSPGPCCTTSAKLDAYAIVGDAIVMSDQGRLYGEIPLGYYRIRTAIEAIDRFRSRPRRRAAHQSSATTARSSMAVR